MAGSSDRPITEPYFRKNRTAFLLTGTDRTVIGKKGRVNKKLLLPRLFVSLQNLYIGVGEIASVYARKIGETDGRLWP